MAKDTRPAGVDSEGKAVFLQWEKSTDVFTPTAYTFVYDDGSSVPAEKIINNPVAANVANSGSDVGFGKGVAPAEKVYEKVLKGKTGLTVLAEDAPTYGDAIYDPVNKIVIVRDENGTSIYNEQGNLISGKGSARQVGIAGGSAGRVGQIDINAVGSYGTPEYQYMAGTGKKQNLAYEGSALQAKAYASLGTPQKPFLVNGKPYTGISGGRQFVNGIQQFSGTTATAWSGTGVTDNPITYNGSPYTGFKNGARYINGVLQSDNAGSVGGVPQGSGTTDDPLIVNGTPYTGTIDGVSYSNGISTATTVKTLTTEDIETKSRRTAQQDFKASLNELGLGDLADEVDRMIRSDFTVSQIKMELPKTQSYQLRFPGIKALRDAGLAISEATYISNERGYLQTLRAYGLDTAILGSRTELGKYIQNQVSPREFEERVNLASSRVQDNPDVIAAFKAYYPNVDESSITAYLLNPTKGMDIIKKQIRISEIGAAAVAGGGFARGTLGINEAQALIGAVGEAGFGALKTEFARAKQLATTQSRLAGIEGQQYSDLEAIQAEVGNELGATLASQRRAARETARFAGGAGITAASLRGTAGI